MKAYLLEADSPLVFRSGKPFGAGSRDGARYPWPSALAGALRTTRFRENQDASPQTLLSITVQGPLLVRRQGNNYVPMIPTPADAISLLPEGVEKPKIYRLHPGEWPEGCGSNLPDGLRPVVLQDAAPLGKPQKLARFWSLPDLLKWDSASLVSDAMLSSTSPLDATEVRTHVAIDGESLTAVQGKLFQIQSLNFGAKRNASGFDRTTWAFAVRSREVFKDQTLTLGGERRTARLSSCTELTSALALPKDHRAALFKAPVLAFTLLTPAYWETGFLPEWLNPNTLEGEHPSVTGLKLKLKAVASGRPDVISGWDLARWAPKPSRRVLPAGSTLWFQVTAHPDKDDWPESLWLSSLCCGQWANDGWGLALPRVTKIS